MLCVPSVGQRMMTRQKNSELKTSEEKQFPVKLHEAQTNPSEVEWPAKFSLTEFHHTTNTDSNIWSAANF